MKAAMRECVNEQLEYPQADGPLSPAWVVQCVVYLYLVIRLAGLREKTTQQRDSWPTLGLPCRYSPWSVHIVSLVYGSIVVLTTVF
jgi:hypothetical protein